MKSLLSILKAPVNVGDIYVAPIGDVWLITDISNIEYVDGQFHRCSTKIKCISNGHRKDESKPEVGKVILRYSIQKGNLKYVSTNEKLVKLYMDSLALSS